MTNLTWIRKPTTAKEAYRQAYERARMSGNEHRDLWWMEGVAEPFRSAAIKTRDMANTPDQLVSLTDARRRLTNVKKELKQAEQRIEMLRTVNNYLEDRMGEFETVLEYFGFHHEASPDKLYEVLKGKQTA